MQGPLPSCLLFVLCILLVWVKEGSSSGEGRRPHLLASSSPILSLGHREPVNTAGCGKGASHQRAIISHLFLRGGSGGPHGAEGDSGVDEDHDSLMGIPDTGKGKDSARGSSPLHPPHHNQRGRANLSSLACFQHSMPMDTTVSPLSVWRISKSLHHHLLFSSAGELLEQLVGLQRFDPVKAATWPKGESAPLSFVSAQLKVVEDRLSSPVMRHRAQDTLCNLFRTLIVTSPADLVSLVCLLRDQVRNYLSSLAAQHYHTTPERSTLGWMASLLGHAGQSRQHRGTREEERERG